MSWTSKLSKEDIAMIIKRYTRGDKVESIANDFGCHHSYPSLLARRLGISTRRGLTNQRYLK